MYTPDSPLDLIYHYCCELVQRVSDFKMPKINNAKFCLSGEIQKHGDQKFNPYGELKYGAVNCGARGDG
jgi:hypothetical protein